MSPVIYYGKRIVPIAGFLMMAGWLVNCNQFHSFTANENANILSVQPILSDNVVEQNFDGGSDVLSGNTTNVTLPDTQGSNGNTTGTTVGTTNGTDNPTGTGVIVTDNNNPNSPTTPTVVNVNPPIIDCTSNNEYQFLREDGVSYTSCQRCDVIDRDGGTCLVRVSPPPVATVTDADVQDPATVWDVANNGGDGDGGDGDGDPLMIDTQGQVYADAKEFSNKWFDRKNYVTAGELELTAPADGTKFDLFGDQVEFAIYGQQVIVPQALAGTANDPRHFKYQISWTQSGRYRFLVLPDDGGNVLGINQLFGDNTLGPDGRFSLDGFTALQKYDGRSADGKSMDQLNRQDGFIDENDAIFNKLRLWADLNDDGNVDSAEEQAQELVTLKQAKIRSISIMPNVNFYERDVYGNEIMYKSVVNFEHSGASADEIRVGIAFDVWFSWDPKENQKLMNLLKK